MSRKKSIMGDMIFELQQMGIRMIDISKETGISLRSLNYYLVRHLVKCHKGNFDKLFHFYHKVKQNNTIIKTGDANE